MQAGRSIEVYLLDNRRHFKWMAFCKNIIKRIMFVNKNRKLPNKIIQDILVLCAART